VVGKSPDWSSKISVTPKLSSSISNYPGAKARNRFQTDLKIVSELVFEDVAHARELEPEFLQECYCESGALSEFSLISRDILQARYSALFDTSVSGPSTEPAVTRKGITPELLAKSLGRPPILILGDVGVGKTTFLCHLMNVEAAEQFANAVALHLDLGHQASLATDLRVFVVEEIAR
jgi:chromosomal replication initiation ATPase DnaA